MPKPSNDKTMDKVDKIIEIIDQYISNNFTGSIQIEVNFSQGGITDAHKIEKVRV
jgi:hypothetical protein